MAGNAEETSFPIISVAKDALRYIPSKIVPALGGFLSIAIYTRFLSPKGYGLYVLVITTISIVSSITFTWLNRASLRYFEDYRTKNLLSGFISTGVTSLIFLFFVVSAIWYTVIVVLKGRLDKDFVYLFKIGTFALVAEVGFSFVLTILRAQRESLKYSFYSSMDTIGKLFLATCLLWFFSLGPQSILWAIIVVTGGIFCFEFVCFFKKWTIRFSLFSKNLVKSFASYGFPLVGESMGMLILAISDRYMIQYFLGTKEVGIYSAGYNMVSSSIDTLFGGVLMLAALPIIFQTFVQKGENETRSLLKGLLGIYLIILLPVVFGIAALSKDIVGVLLGESFQNTYIILPWVAVGIFFWGLTTYMIKSCELKEKTLYITYLMLFAGVLNIVLNLFLIPGFGIVGAGISTLAAYLCCFVTSLIISRKIFPIPFPWIVFGKSFLAASGMYLILSFRVFHHDAGNIGFLIADILLGAITYFAILVLLREKTLFSISMYLKRLFQKQFSTV